MKLSQLLLDDGDIDKESLELHACTAKFISPYHVIHVQDVSKKSKTCMPVKFIPLYYQLNFMLRSSSVVIILP